MSLQVSKALLADYIAAQRKGKPMKGLGLEHMNSSCPVIPEELKSHLLRDPSIQVQFITLRHFVKETSFKIRPVFLYRLGMEFFVCCLLQF